MDMIWVDPAVRGRGVGRTLVARWESAMRASGASILMTSSQEDEPAPQAWHGANGFRKAGSLSLGHAQPVAEIFLVKDLGG